jgi:hypothetical protein
VSNLVNSRRQFLKAAASATGALMISPDIAEAQKMSRAESENAESTRADYTLRIGASPIEIARSESFLQ